MPFIYDNLIATLIGMTVVLILSSIQMAAMQNNTSRTSRNMVNTQAQQLANWLEEDLSRIGQNMSPDAVPYGEPMGPGGSDPDWSADWHTTEFSFEYKNDKGDRIEVKYKLVETSETAVIEGQDDVTLARLERFEGLSGKPKSLEGEATNLGYFKIDLLDEQREPGATGDDAELVRARFSVLAPFQSENTIPRRARRAVVVPLNSD